LGSPLINLLDNALSIHTLGIKLSQLLLLQQKMRIVR